MELLGVHKLVAQAIIMPFVTLITFAGDRHWTFGEAIGPTG